MARTIRREATTQQERRVQYPTKRARKGEVRTDRQTTKRTLAAYR